MAEVAAPYCATFITLLLKSPSILIVYTIQDAKRTKQWPNYFRPLRVRLLPVGTAFFYFLSNQKVCRKGGHVFECGGWHPGGHECDEDHA